MSTARIFGNFFFKTHTYSMTALFAILIMCFLTSCDSPNKTSKEEYESMALSDKVNLIYKIFPDTNTVSRVILATPEHLKGISEGKYTPSEKFIERLNTVNLYWIESDYNNPKTLREYDPDFSWYDKVWDMDTLYGWYWFWGILVVCVIISILSENGAILTIVSALYCLCGLISFISFCIAKPIDVEPYPAISITDKTPKSTVMPQTEEIEVLDTDSVSTDSISTTEQLVDTVEVCVNGLETSNPSSDVLNDMTTETKTQPEEIEISETSSVSTDSESVKEKIVDIQENSVDSLGSSNPSSEVLDDQSTEVKSKATDQPEEMATLDTSSVSKDSELVEKQTENIQENSVDSLGNSIHSSDVIDGIAIEANPAPIELTPEHSRYADAYDSLILKGIDVDSIASLSQINADVLVKMRFGIISFPKSVSNYLSALNLAIEDDVLDDFKVNNEICKDSVYLTGFKPDKTFFIEMERNRNQLIEEALAVNLAQYYSEVMDDYLEREFGFFKAIWQGIRYIFLSKEKYVASFEKGISKEFDKANVSEIILRFANTYKQNIEFEYQVVFGSVKHFPDFENISLTAFSNPMNEDIKSKIIERGALEAKDIGLTAMECLIGWLISSIILSFLCNSALNSVCDDELAVKGLLNFANPTSTWGKIVKGIASVGADLFFESERAKIKAKYDTYKSIAGITLTVVVYVITYFCFIIPSIKLDTEINQLLTEQFIDYYTSIDLPLTQLFNEMVSKL